MNMNNGLSSHDTAAGAAEAVENLRILKLPIRRARRAGENYSICRVVFREMP